jgi:L-lactate dehydrogenase complex protein LldG
MSVNREFIENIARKLGRPTPTSVQPIEVKVPFYRLNSQEERIENFLTVWEALNGKGVKVNTTEEAVNAIKSWFGDQPEWLSPQAIFTWSELPVMARASLEQLGWPTRSYTELSVSTSDRTAAIGQAELGITGADYGIAQSGSLVLKSGSKRGRAVSLVPTRHLTFIPGSVIRDSLDQIMEELQQGGNIPAAIEIISGPSRTSDIEMDLSIGVHGPVEVYAIVIANQ